MRNIFENIVPDDIEHVDQDPNNFLSNVDLAAMAREANKASRPIAPQVMLKGEKQALEKQKRMAEKRRQKELKDAEIAKKNAERAEKAQKPKLTKKQREALEKQREALENQAKSRKT